MMRLTLRSGKDGRFLARVVDAGGHPFVLDFGDRRIIDDVQQRLSKGFTMWRFGQTVHATPQDPELLTLLAEFYCGEGLLVAVEEPTWTGRDSTLDERIPVPEADRRTQDTLKTVVPDRDDSTESVSLDDMTDLGKFLEVTGETNLAELRQDAGRGRGAVPAPDDPIEDAKTEFADLEDAAGTELLPKRK